MKDIRVFYRKNGPLRFVSHLDMNRYIPRLIRLAGLPVWFTQGFNQHAYLTFALPLSLGFNSAYEVVDMRLTEDDFSLEEVQRRLNEKAVEGFQVFRVSEPKYKPGQIGFCRYAIEFHTGVNTAALESFLQREQILVEKRNKKGKYVAVDIAPKIQSFSIHENCLRITVAAGSDNLNPTLLLSAFLKNEDACDYTVTREALYTAEMEPFE